MTHDPIDDLLRRTAAHDRSIAIPETMVQDVVARAAEPRRRRGGHRRRIGIILAALVIAVSATSVAVPDARHSISRAFHAFGDFFTDGGDAPGTPMTTTDTDNNAPWFNGTDTEKRTVIAEHDGRMLIGYRQTSTGQACLALDMMMSMCAPDADWAQMLKDKPMFSYGPVAPSDRHGNVPFGVVPMFMFGIVDDTVGAVAIRYADGSEVRVDDVHHGFVLSADPKREPRLLIAYGHDGQILMTVRQQSEDWRIVR